MYARIGPPNRPDVLLPLPGDLRSARSSPSADPHHGRKGAFRPYLRVCGDVLPHRAPLGSTGEALEGASASGVLLDPQHPPPDGEDPARHPVSLVRRPVAGGRRLGPFHFFPEPGTTACLGGGEEILREGSFAGAFREASFRRALHGRRDPDRGVGVAGGAPPPPRGAPHPGGPRGSGGG